MKFKTFDELVEWIEDIGPVAGTMLTHLNQFVEEEADILMNKEIQNGSRKRRSKALLKEATKDAQEMYLEEINGVIRNPEPITNHWQVMGNRIYSNAWAIAVGILDYANEK